MWALIIDGAAFELFDTEPSFHPDLQVVAAPAGTRVGDLYDGKVFSRPPAPAPSIPRSVTKVQAVLALYAQSGSVSGKTLLDDVNAAVAAADPRVGLAWTNATSIDRDGTFVTEVAKAAPLNMTDAQLDGLFSAASLIVV